MQWQQATSSLLVNNEKDSASNKRIDIRIQQRNGKKCITTVSGLGSDLDYKRILHVLKKSFACNGKLIEDKEFGTVLLFQGDQRENIIFFLTSEDLATKDQIRIHGT